MSGPETDGPLLLAVPSKGRLQENATAFFGRAGLSFVQPRGARDYRGSVAGVEDAEILFLSASEITAQLAQGTVHLGVTGEDLVRETIEEAERSVALLAPLGFGSANVVVAVPQAWIDVRTIADLEDVASDIHQRSGRRMRVATKYVSLTRRFFAQHGLFDYQIVESAGATEGAPAAGTAEIIVDITTTGATLASNALKVLDDGVILKSEANLVAALKAPWSERARRAAATILSRIDAAETGRRIREIRVAVTPIGGDKIESLAKAFSATLPFGLGGTGTIATLHVAAKSAEALAQALVREGAETVVVGKVDYVFSGSNALTEALLARIGDPSSV